MTEPRVQALRLLGKWSSIARGHVALAAGCSCGVGVSNLRVADFEQQILDYLHTKHAANERVCELLAQAGYRAEQSGDLGDLLRAVARRQAAGEAMRELLADVERTLASFEAQHSGR